MGDPKCYGDGPLDKYTLSDIDDALYVLTQHVWHIASWICDNRCIYGIPYYSSDAHDGLEEVQFENTYCHKCPLWTWRLQDGDESED